MLITLLHAGELHGNWWLAWRADPLLTPLLVAAAAGYLVAYRSAAKAGRPVPPDWQVVAYLAGLATLALALTGPFDHFNGVLFSVHMTQHLLLMLVVAPLLLLGRPVQILLRGLPPRHSRALMRHTVGHRRVRSVLTVLTHPVSVVLLFNGSFILWHLPRFYQAAVRNEMIHEIEHAAFLLTALLFWWVLIDPVPRHHRLSTTAAALALFATWMASDLMCATITLAQDLIYPIYADTPKPWGLTAYTDQRLGGIIMWVAGGGFYAAVLIGILAVPYLRERPARQVGSHAATQMGGVEPSKDYPTG